MITHRQIKRIEAAYGSPFYLFDEEVFSTNYRRIVNAFCSGYDRFILAYSYKTNYIPYLCRIIKQMGGYAEVVSRLEYNLALRIGQDPKRIIFNGPVKHYEDISAALDNKSTVNLDCGAEIEHVLRYAQQHPDEQVKVGLRINIGLSEAGGASHIQGGIKVGRFGFSPQADSIGAVIAKLTAAANVTINSLHGHTSTTDRSVWCYEVITKTLCDIAGEFLPETVEYINIGGGIFGDVPEKMRWCEVPSFDEYAEAVCTVLAGSKWVGQHRPWLVLEPGVAMAANTMSFVTKVVSVKSIAGKVFAVVDGSAFNTKPTLHKINQPFEVIKASAAGKTGTFSVAGSTCMEKDYLLTEITAPDVEQGDYIRIDNVGAYTIVLSPPFINAAPAILVKDGSGYKAIRKRQSFEDMFAGYSFE